MLTKEKGDGDEDGSLAISHACSDVEAYRWANEETCGGGGALADETRPPRPCRSGRLLPGFAGPAADDKANLCVETDLTSSRFKLL